MHPFHNKRGMTLNQETKFNKIKELIFGEEKENFLNLFQLLEKKISDLKQDNTLLQAKVNSVDEHYKTELKALKLEINNTLKMFDQKMITKSELSILLGSLSKSMTNSLEDTNSKEENYLNLH